MLLFENREQKLINTLKFIGSPFKKFVSTGEIAENIGLVPSRQEFLADIVKIIKNNENFILPILGTVGVGKTHLFWALKNLLYKKIIHATAIKVINSVTAIPALFFLFFLFTLCSILIGILECRDSTELQLFFTS